MQGKVLVSCYLQDGELAEITRASELDRCGMKEWMREALLGAARVSQALAKARRRRWDPITEATPGMTEITASLAEKPATVHIDDHASADDSD